MTLRSVPRQLRFDGEEWVKPPKVRRAAKRLRVLDDGRLAEMRSLTPELEDPREIEILAWIFFDGADNYAIADVMGGYKRNWVQTKLPLIARSLGITRTGRQLRPAITAELARRQRARQEKAS